MGEWMNRWVGGWMDELVGGWVGGCVGGQKKHLPFTWLDISLA